MMSTENVKVILMANNLEPLACSDQTHRLNIDFIFDPYHLQVTTWYTHPSIGTVECLTLLPTFNVSLIEILHHL